MAKPDTYPVKSPGPGKQEEDRRQPEPLSGSKEVKNRNHSRQNHGEGS